MGEPHSLTWSILDTPIPPQKKQRRGPVPGSNTSRKARTKNADSAITNIADLVSLLQPSGVSSPDSSPHVRSGEDSRPVDIRVVSNNSLANNNGSRESVISNTGLETMDTESASEKHLNPAITSTLYSSSSSLSSLSSSSATNQTDIYNVAPSVSMDLVAMAPVAMEYVAAAGNSVGSDISSPPCTSNTADDILKRAMSSTLLTTSPHNALSANVMAHEELFQSMVASDPTIFLNGLGKEEDGGGSRNLDLMQSLAAVSTTTATGTGSGIVPSTSVLNSVAPTTGDAWSNVVPTTGDDGRNVVPTTGDDGSSVVPITTGDGGSSVVPGGGSENGVNPTSDGIAAARTCSIAVPPVSLPTENSTLSEEHTISITKNSQAISASNSDASPVVLTQSNPGSSVISLTQSDLSDLINSLSHSAAESPATNSSSPTPMTATPPSNVTVVPFISNSQLYLYTLNSDPSDATSAPLVNCFPNSSAVKNFKIPKKNSITPSGKNSQRNRNKVSRVSTKRPRALPQEVSSEEAVANSVCLRRNGCGLPTVPHSLNFSITSSSGRKWASNDLKGKKMLGMGGGGLGWVSELCYFICTY